MNNNFLINIKKSFQIKNKNLRRVFKKILFQEIKK